MAGEGTGILKQIPLPKDRVLQLGWGRGEGGENTIIAIEATECSA